MATEDHQADRLRALAVAARGRRERLGKSQQLVAEISGLSVPTVRRVETGKPVTNYRRLDDALEWKADTIRGILKGDEPPPVEPAGPRFALPAGLTADQCQVVIAEGVAMRSLMGFEFAKMWIARRVRELQGDAQEGDGHDGAPDDSSSLAGSTMEVEPS